MLSIITLMQAGLPLAMRALDRAGQFVGAVDEFAVAAERRDREIVARGQ